MPGVLLIPVRIAGSLNANAQCAMPGFRIPDFGSYGLPVPREGCRESCPRGEPARSPSSRPAARLGAAPISGRVRFAAALAAQDSPVRLVLADLHLVTEPGLLRGLDFALLDTWVLPGWGPGAG
jgi:hypothetical protein